MTCIMKKTNQPHYSEAMKKAIADIMEECHREGKCFIAYNNRRTKNINIIIGSNFQVEPEMPEDEEQIGCY